MTDQRIGQQVLEYPDGGSVVLLEQGRDEAGEFLLVEHTIIRKGPVNGPHWHPELEESFTIVEGTIRFRVDGKDATLTSGGTITVQPRQVHQFWKEGDARLVMRHRIRPPGAHWRMFAIIHKLELEGLTNSKGIPRNPLWIGLAWESMDGYLAGPPAWLQRILFGGLARLAHKRGYRV